MKQKQKPTANPSKTPDDSTTAIRNRYQEFGVENYYEQFGKDYHNPHYLQIEALIERNLEKFDLSHVLDLCCGSGEVSIILQKHNCLTSACDPFTQAAFSRKIGRTCWGYSFDDIIKGALQKETFTTIFCSFALHLCEERKLYPLVHQLLRDDHQLVVITPHKRPDLRTVDGIDLAWSDFALTERGKKVYLNAYRLR